MFESRLGCDGSEQHCRYSNCAKDSDILTQTIPITNRKRNDVIQGLHIQQLIYNDQAMVTHVDRVNPYGTIVELDTQGKYAFTEVSVGSTWITSPSVWSSSLTVLGIDLCYVWRRNFYCCC